MAKATKITVTAKSELDVLREDSNVLAHLVPTAAFNRDKFEAGLP